VTFATTSGAGRSATILPIAFVFVACGARSALESPACESTETCAVENADASVVPDALSDASVDADVSSLRPDGPPTGFDGGPGYGSGRGDCDGDWSHQLGSKYDDECDGYAYWAGARPGGNPCTPGGNACAAMDGTEGFTFCCFIPPQPSYCRTDYGGTPQCVPW
jgi:hypothetical protein